MSHAHTSNALVLSNTLLPMKVLCVRLYSFISLSSTVLRPCKYELTSCAMTFAVVRLNT